MMHDGASSLDTCTPVARCVYHLQRWEGIMRRCSCSTCSQTLSSWVGGPLLLWCGGSCLLRWAWVNWWWCTTLAPCLIFGFFHLCPLLFSEPTPAQNAVNCFLLGPRPAMPEGALWISALVMAEVEWLLAFEAYPEDRCLSENSCYIYIYIYMIVRVHMCVCDRAGGGGGMRRGLAPPRREVGFLLK